jgi:hypothetical protein
MDTMGLITLVGIVTICASTYMILYSGRLYEILAPFLTLFERKNAYREAEAEHPLQKQEGKLFCWAWETTEARSQST